MNADHHERERQRVLRLEHMMTDAYDIALRKVRTDRRLQQTLAPFREHHRENAEALQKASGHNAEATLELDEAFRTYVQEVLDTIGDSVRRDEAIGELRVAEAALGMVYGQVLEAETDAEFAGVLKKCMRNEAEHVGVLSMASETART